MLKEVTELGVPYSREGLSSIIYLLPGIGPVLGSTIEVCELTGRHGVRTIGEYPRYFFIQKEKAIFQINDEEVSAGPGDKVTIPPHTTYDMRVSEKDHPVEFVLFMPGELLDLTKLPK